MQSAARRKAFYINGMTGWNDGSGAFRLLSSTAAENPTKPSSSMKYCWTGQHFLAE